MFKIAVRFVVFFFLSIPLHSREWGSRENLEGKKIHREEAGYRILSLDGGGIRGVFSAQLLAMLEDEFHFLQHVDLFVGTSTGSILACSLAYGVPPKEIVEFFRAHAKKIFTERGGVYSYLQMQSKYDRENFQTILELVFPKNLKLGNLPKKVVCVSFELFNEVYNSWTPALIDNFDPITAQNVGIADAILRSSAAPTYFPSYQGYIDGGAVANNPSMMALARALDQEGACVPLEDIRLLSVGTGMVNSYIPEDVDWGGIEWMVRAPLSLPTPPHPLFDILYNGTISVPHFQCSQILGANYQRLNAFLSRDLLLDNWREVDFLIEQAKKFPEDSPEEWKKIKDWVREKFLQ